MVLILENIGFFCHPGPGCRDPKANCKQSIESGHRRLETGGWLFMNQRMWVCDSLGRLDSRKRENLAGATT